MPALKQAAAGLAGGAPGFAVLFGFAFKAFSGVSEMEFPLRSLLAVVSYVPDRALTSLLGECHHEPEH